MKYLDKLMELGCFSRKDVVALTGNEHAAHSLLYDYTKAGYLERVRRDLYTTISLETKQKTLLHKATMSSISMIILYSGFFIYYRFCDS